MLQYILIALLGVMVLVLVALLSIVTTLSKLASVSAEEAESIPLLQRIAENGKKLAANNAFKTGAALLITLLIGASADGLQVLKRDGTWFAVQAQGEDIVVNVGDMLQTLTNNVLQSTTHRVVNPPRELMGTSRYSVPFFLHPKSSMSLACLESCISNENPKAYQDITAGEYLDQRLREIGLKM